MLRSQKRVTAGYGTGFRGLHAAVRLRCAVLQVSNTFLFGAKCRAENHAGLALDAVTDNPATAVIARRRQFVNGAFKAIERVRCTGDRDFKRFVILISANFTRTHRLKPPDFYQHPGCHRKNVLRLRTPSRAGFSGYCPIQGLAGETDYWYLDCIQVSRGKHGCKSGGTH